MHGINLNQMEMIHPEIKSMGSSLETPFEDSASTIYGKAIILNGQSQYARVTDSAFLSPKTQITLAGRLKLNLRNPQAWSSVMMKTSTASRQDGYGLYLENESNNLCAFVNQWDSGLCYQISTNQWYHFSLTYDGQTLRYYRNGTLAGSRSINQVLRSNVSDLLIGASLNNSGQAGDYWNGWLDEIQIYDKALSDSEITKLANQSSDPPLPTSDDLVMVLKFNGNSQDSSGNQNNAQIFGSYSYSTHANFDSAVDLNNNSYLVVNNSNSLNSTSQISFGGYVKLNQTNNSRWESVMMKTSNIYRSDGYGMYLEVGPSLCAFISNYDRKVCTNIVQGTWTHVFATYDGTQLKIYKDGLFQAAISIYSQVVVNSAPLYIGSASGLSGTAGDLWNGSLDEIYIYNRALGDQQVADLAGVITPPLPVLSPLKLSLALNGNTSDSSGNQNNGVAFGSYSFTSHPGFSTGIDLNNNAYITVDHVEDLSPKDQISFGGFVRLNQFERLRWESVLMKTSTIYREDGYGMYLDVNAPIICAFVNRYDKRTCTSINYNWTHIFATYDGVTLRIYKDGVLANYATINANLITNNAKLFVGASLGPNGAIGDLWNGSLDEIKIYSKALTEQEVKPAERSSYFNITTGNKKSRIRLILTTQNGLSRILDDRFVKNNIHRRTNAGWETSYLCVFRRIVNTDSGDREHLILVIEKK
ncbi:MAG: LamG domain-containing protein [Acidobacteria bacterium]|nr:LamG domain-containing protein [Acidobacteriota bacterium]